MRTIEVSEEEYQFLTKLAILMKTQANRGTSFPLFCIYDKQDDETIKFINCFFSEDAMNKHLEEIGDELNKPFTHIRSAAYNEEMKTLMRIIIRQDDLVLQEHNNLAYE